MASPSHRQLRAIAVAVLSLSACRLNPATDRIAIGLVSEDKEVALGEALDREIRSTLHVYGGSGDIAGLTRRVGHRLAKKSERPDLPWKFRVLDDPTANAFALPGGYVYITRGLVGLLNSEAELAAVLSHEVAHVTALHSSIAIRDRQRAARWSGVFDRTMNFHNLSTESELRLLAHNRERELEADRLALRYLERAGYPPEAMASVIELLGRLDTSGGKIPPWSRTHPAPKARAKALESELHLDAAALPSDNEFVARLEGFVVGVDPRNGHLDGSLYRHGRSGFAVELPPGWETELVGSMAIAAPPKGDVLLIAAPTLFPEPTVEQVLAALSASESIMLYDKHEYTVGGIPVVRGTFRTVEEPPLLGTFQLAQGSDGVITLLAVGTQPDWAANDTPLVLALNSQRSLTEADATALQPTTISLVPAAEGQTLREIAAGPHELPMLRRLNRVRSDDPLEGGRLLKRVPVPLPTPPAVETKGDRVLTDPFAPASQEPQTLPDPFPPKGFPPDPAGSKDL